MDLRPSRQRNRGKRWHNHCCITSADRYLFAPRPPRFSRRDSSRKSLHLAIFIIGSVPIGTATAAALLRRRAAGRVFGLGRAQCALMLWRRRTGCVSAAWFWRLVLWNRVPLVAAVAGSRS